MLVSHVMAVKTIMCRWEEGQLEASGGEHFLTVLKHACLAEFSCCKKIFILYSWVTARFTKQENYFLGEIWQLVIGSFRFAVFASYVGLWENNYDQVQ